MRLIWWESAEACWQIPSGPLRQPRAIKRTFVHVLTAVTVVLAGLEQVNPYAVR